MMVSNGFNFPPNGYYNPPKPPITTKNYQNALTYGDDKRYGGNGDGKLDATELTSIKKVFDYASDYYKNMYQQSGDAKYMAWADHYGRDSKATDNMSNNFSVFATNINPMPGGGDFKITKEGIEQLANKDGNGNTISLNDLAQTRFSGFQNDKLATTHYQDVVKYGDDKRYGGNGDGKLDDTELANIKKTFDYATTYYKDQATTATTAEDKAKFTAWSNYYANDAKAAVNIQSEQNLFMQDGDPSKPVNGSIPPIKTPLNLTMQRVQALAGKDGDASTLSIQDLAKAQYPNFTDNGQPQIFPMPYGGNPQYGGYQPQYAGYQQPIDYSQQQAMYYNQPRQFGGQEMPLPPIEGLAMPPLGAGMFGVGTLPPVPPQVARQQTNDVPSILAQQKEATIKQALQGIQSNFDGIGQAREQLANTLKTMIDNQLDRSPESPSTQALAARTEAIKRLDDALVAQQQRLLSKKSFYESGQAAQYTTQELQSIMKVENTLGSLQTLTADLNPQSETAKNLQTRIDAVEKERERLIKRQPAPAEEPLTPKTATQILIDNFGTFESLLDTDKNRQDGITSFDELVAYTLQPYNPQQPWSSNVSPKVKRAVQYFIDNRATTFDKMEIINDKSGKKDAIFSLDELRKFLAQQG